jgi:hypothetical protein
MPQIKKCCVLDCSSSGLTKKTSFHCFPANLELNLQWKEPLINHAGSTISMIFFFSKTPISFCFLTDVECFTESSVVCGEHFSTDSFLTTTKRRMLIPGAIPSIFKVYLIYY